MEKTYNPQAIEQRWYQIWEEQGHFKPSGEGDPYCIMIPPPNVTGTLHMGHAFQETIIDSLIRYYRMKGRNTLWQPGTDHAGIATQMVVERQLASTQTSRHDLGREEFVKRVWDWKAESGGTITRQLRRLGASPDWSRERFTMDEGMSDAVREVFVQMFDDGLIYRGKRLVNWDPVFRTALSDVEVLKEEEQGKLWHFTYPLSDGSGTVTVATTRPETMLGDTAVAVHPDDERFQALIGKSITLPLVGREIFIIGDDYVDPEFGSGCVKITPAHDFNDYDIGKRHSLPIINILNDDATLNDAVPEAYRGLDRYDARKKVVADLEAAGLLAGIDNHTMVVPRGDRSGTVIEPYLTDQWFVDLTQSTQADGRPGGKALITDPSLEVVRSGKIKFVPENHSKTYYQWLENIEDWCISRQIWWGHRIPAWFDNEGKVYVAHDEAAVREKYKLDAAIELRQDDDVLDTWFSSALWPFSTLGWPEKTPALDTFYPGSVLVTGFDIIFYWVARMIMFGTRFMDGVVPFHEVYIHGLVRDANGQKMSKTKGNVLDPLDIIDGVSLEALLIDGVSLEALLEKRTNNLMQPHMAPKIAEQTKKEFPEGIASYGTDALRFAFVSLASRFDMKRVEGYRNFCNKLYNATRFVLMNTDGIEADDVPANRNVIDEWIVSRLQHTELAVAEHIAVYRFDLAANALYEFIWNEYCDWYLEMAKPMLDGDNPSAESRQATRITLVRVLEAVLRLAHPFMPFITEELWQQVAPRAGIKGPTISIQPYPVADQERINTEAEATIEWVKQSVMGVRKIRSEMNINPGKRLPVLVTNATETDRERLVQNQRLLTFLARLESVEILEDASSAPESASALVDQMQLLLPMAGLIDKDAELQRLDKEIPRVTSEVERLSKKLSNKGFTDKAPEKVVALEQAKLDDAKYKLMQLIQQRAKIEKL